MLCCEGAFSGNSFDFFSLPDCDFLDSIVGLCLFSGFPAAISPVTEGKKYIRNTALAYVDCFSHTATEVQTYKNNCSLKL